MERWHWLSGVVAALVVYGFLHLLAALSTDMLAAAFATAVIAVAIIIKLLDRPQK